MRKFQILFFSFLSVVVASSCNHYRSMQKVQSDPDCMEKFIPVFRSELYQTSIDVAGRHLSGILFFKKMGDTSLRIVFSNEAGFTFFDFGFLPGDSFNVYQITPKLNKKAVIKTLRKDFDLVLFRNRNITTAYALRDGKDVYHAFPQSKGVNYYVSDSGCNRLIKMQRASEKKPVMEAMLWGAADQAPDSISIRHLNFNFNISLKKITPLELQ